MHFPGCFSVTKIGSSVEGNFYLPMARTSNYRPALLSITPRCRRTVTKTIHREVRETKKFISESEKGLDWRNPGVRLLPRSYNGSRIPRFLPLPKSAFLLFLCSAAFPCRKPGLGSAGGEVLRAEQRGPFVAHVYNPSHNGAVIS